MITRKYLILRRYLYNDTSVFTDRSLFIYRFNCFRFRSWLTLQQFRIYHHRYYEHTDYRSYGVYMYDP